MNLDGTNWVRAIVWVSLLGLLAMSLIWIQQAERREMERLHPGLRQIRLSEQRKDTFSISSAHSNEVPIKAGPVSFSKRVQEMTLEEKDEIEKQFKEKFRPAVEKWFRAYENRIPFRIEEFTVDKFHSTLGTHMYTFMLGDTTLTLVTEGDSHAPAKVGYLMVRQAALDLNRLPGKDFVPNLNSPVELNDVIRMVKADSGVEFKPNEVLMKPTAKACALNGGAFVDLLPTGADPNNALNYKISMVFDGEGKLVNYERSPSF